MTILGKGLESLIPPKKPQDPNAIQGNQQVVPPVTQPPQLPQAAPVEPVQPVAPVVAAPVVSYAQEELNQKEIKAVAEMPSFPDNPKGEEHKPVQQEKPVYSHQPVFASTPGKERSEAIFHIEIEKIRSNPQQPRHNFEEEGLKELASSIREFGVLQPILVSKVETETENGRTVEYELIAGERRLMASKLAGLRTIPAIIRRLTPEREKLEIAIIENIQRRDLDPIEEAKAFARLQDEFKLTQREIAAKLGKSREAVANAVRLLNLPSDVQEALSQKKISESQGRLLLSIADIGEQRKMFEEIMKGGGLSIREMKSKIQKKKDMDLNEMSFVKPETLALKEKLEELLGTKVDLREEGDKGKITINFYSKEELKGIVGKLFREGQEGQGGHTS